MGYQKTKNTKTNRPKCVCVWGGGVGSKNENLSPCTKLKPEVYGKVKWMATSERVNLFIDTTMAFIRKR